MLIIAPITLILASILDAADGFVIPEQVNRLQHFATRPSALAAETTDGDFTTSIGDESDSLLAQSSSRLSHVMMYVPSVDKTVAYWKETANGQVTASSKLPDKNNDKEGDDELRSAMVVLGNGKTTKDCFALELVKNKHKTFDLGNCIPYLGVSSLVGYSSKEDLIKLIMGGSSSSDDDKPEEPNGIPIQSCPSAPGDFFSRFCLCTTDIPATCQFYTEILGMDLAGADGKLLCLRYPKKKNSDADAGDDDGASYGISTTLVFMPHEEELNKGNCLDHFVIATNANMDDAYTQIKESLEEQNLSESCPLFMKPTEMFGKKVIGVMDPNGYKVILAGNT